MFNTLAVFWIAVFLIVYTYVGYPLLIWIWAGWRERHGRQVASPELTGRRGNFQSSVSVLVIAHNEEARIAAKIRNLLALDPCPGRMEIVVASDGSTDSTAARAMGVKNAAVRVVQFPEQRGKPAVLNQLVPTLKGDIVVLVDVRQHIESNALRALLAWFSDPEIGAVSGELILQQQVSSTASKETGEGVGFYWRYEKFIRRQEARVDSTVGVTGAFYAIRRDLFRPIPAQTLLDDVLVPMAIVRQGYRVVFASGAQAEDQVSASAQAEFIRKVRTIAGNYQLLFQHPWLLNPFHNRLWFQTLSHKFLRLLGPLFLLLAFVSNLFLLDQLFYQFSFAVQILFYLAAACGQLEQSPAKFWILVNVPYAFCLLNWATVIGFSRFALNSQRVTWQKSERVKNIPISLVPLTTELSHAEIKNPPKPAGKVSPSRI